LEVKFSEPGEIFRVIKNSIKATLEKGSNFTNTTNFSFGNRAKPKFSSPKFSFEKLAQIGQAQKSFFDTAQSFSNKNLVHEQKVCTSITNDEFPNQTAANCIGNLKLVGQMANKYIVSEGDSGVFIFDQHALHERQRFEKFYDEIEKNKVNVQKLLLPEKIRFDEGEISILREHESFLEKIGFKVAFLKDEIEISETPVLMEKENFSELFGDFINFFENEKIGETAVEKFLRKILEYKSCRGAVMFGEKLAVDEMQKLIDDFSKTKWRLSCPHGRPNHVFLSFDEIDSKFHR